MANKVSGINVVTQMLIDSVWYPIFCGKSAEFTINQDEIEVTHVNSGISREYVPGMSNATLNVAGVTVIDNTEGRISWTYLAQNAIRRAINTYRMMFTAENGTITTVSFEAFWTTGAISRDVTSWSQSNVSMRVTGGITFESPVPPPEPPACAVEDTIIKELAEGATQVTDVLLVPGVGETITILHVTRTGVTLYETTGTPGNLEFRYDSATGAIQFDPANPGMPPNPDLEKVSIEYKIET